MESDFDRFDSELYNLSRVWILIMQVFFLEEEDEDKLYKFCVRFDLDSSIDDKEMEKLMEENDSYNNG